MNSGSEDGNIAEALRGIMDKVLSDIYMYICDFNLPVQIFGRIRQKESREMK